MFAYMNFRSAEDRYLIFHFPCLEFLYEPLETLHDCPIALRHICITVTHSTYLQCIVITNFYVTDLQGVLHTFLLVVGSIQWLQNISLFHPGGFQEPLNAEWNITSKFFQVGPSPRWGLITGHRLFRLFSQ